VKLSYKLIEITKDNQTSLWKCSFSTENGKCVVGILVESLILFDPVSFRTFFLKLY
jgi:hypothetical protein